MLAESHLTWRLFGGMVRRIGALAAATGSTEAMSTAKSGKLRTRGPDRCLRDALKKMGVAILDFAGSAGAPSCGVENGSRKKNAARRNKGSGFGLY